MALNLGRARGDITGSQDTALNGIKSEKTAFPKFTGKNAAELNALAQFIEDKFASDNEFSKEIASTNVDTTLERMHTALLKLKEFSDSDDTEAYEKLKNGILEQVRSIVADGTTDESAASISDEDKKLLAETIADEVHEKSSTVDDIKSFISENQAKSAAEDNIKKSKTKIDSFLKFLGKQMSALNKRVNIVGSSIKDSELFKIKNPLTNLSNKLMSPIKAVQTSVGKINKGLAEKKKNLKMKVAAVPVVGKFFSPKDKKALKKKDSTFNALGNFLKKIKSFFANIAKHVLDFIAMIAIGIAKIFAKCIGIILKPIFTFLWASPIGITLVLISVALLLIGLAVKKLVDYVVDDLGPIIKEKLKAIDPTTLNKVLTSASKFLDTFTNILNGLFAPIIVIGKVIAALIKPIGKAVAMIAETVLKVLKPALEWIGKILIAVIPVFGKLILGVVTALSALIDPIIKVVGFIAKFLATVISVAINAISLIVEKILPYIMPVIDVIADIVGTVIVGFLKVFKTVLDAVKIILDEIIVPLLDGVLKVAIEGIKLAVDGIKKGIEFVKGIIGKVWDFIKNIASSVWNKILEKISSWADVEVGVWKFKFHPFGFLKGIKPEPDTSPIEVDTGNEEAQKVIDELNGRLKTLQLRYDGAQDQIKLLQQSLKEASEIKVDKKTIDVMTQQVDSILNKLHLYIVEYRNNYDKLLGKLDKMSDSGSGFGMGMLVKAVYKVGDAIKDGFNTVRDFMSPVVNYVGEKLGLTLDSILNLLNNSSSIATEFKDKIFQFIDNFTEIFLKAFESVSKDISNAMQLSLDILKSAVDLTNSEISLLSEKIRNFIDSIAIITQDISDSLAKTIQITIQNITVSIQLTMQQIRTGIQVISDKISNFIEDSSNTFQDVASAIAEQVNLTIQQAIDKASEFIDTVKSSIVLLSNEICSIAESICTRINASIDSFSQSILATITDIRTFIEESFNTVKDGIKQVTEKVADIISCVKPTILEAFETVKTGISEAIKQSLSFVDLQYSNISNFMNVVLAKINELIENIKQNATDVSNVMASDAISAITSVKDTLTAIVQQVQATSESIIGKIHDSVFSVINETVQDILKHLDAISNEIGNVIVQVKDSIANILVQIDTKLQKTLTDILSNTLTSIQSLTDNIGNIIKNVNANVDKFIKVIEESTATQTMKLTINDALDVKISPESIKNLFDSLTSSADSSGDKLNNIATDLKSENAENERKTKQNDDISNSDLKKILALMMTSIDDSLLSINKKLDVPLVIPMNMTLNNQALMGVN